MTDPKKPADTGTPQGGTTEKPFEIDYERLKDGDAEYAAEVNKTLAETQPPEEEPVVPGSEGEGQGAAPPKSTEAGDDYFEFEGGDPVYKGEPFKVKKAELKVLAQKGRHMDVVLEEVAPIRRMAREVPQLAEVLALASKDPAVVRKLRQAAEVIKSGGDVKPPEEEEDDLSDLQVEGLDEMDIQNIGKVNKALKDRERKKEEESRKAEEREAIAEYERRDTAARAYVTALRTSEGDTFEKVRPYMKELMAEAERTASPEEFAKFKETILNPFAVDAEGVPIFHHFYGEAKKRYQKDLETDGGGSGPGTVRRGVELKDPPTNKTRLAPGNTATAGGKSTRGEQIDWEGLSQAEFDRRMNEALARA